MLNYDTFEEKIKLRGTLRGILNVCDRICHEFDIHNKYTKEYSHLASLQIAVVCGYLDNEFYAEFKGVMGWICFGVTEFKLEEYDERFYTTVLNFVGNVIISLEDRNIVIELD